jgi:hypothetical protein
MQARTTGGRVKMDEKLITNIETIKHARITSEVLKFRNCNL